MTLPLRWFALGLLLVVPLSALAAAPKPKARPAPAATTPAVPTPAPSPSTPEVELKRLQALFDELDYENVVTASAALLARSDVPLDVRIEAYRLQGSSRAIVQDPVDAEQPFRLLLRARPEYELPDSTPPKILSVFRKVQSEERALAATMRQVERKRLIEGLTLIGEPPATAAGGKALAFSWRLRDPQGVVDTVELPYRRAGQRSFSTLSLERTESGLWRGVIPGEFTADEKGFTLEYFVRTLDREGPLLMLGSETAPKQVVLSAGAVQIARARPVPVGALVTTSIVTAVFAAVAGGFAIATMQEQAAYRTGAAGGSTGAELLALKNQGTTYATVANAGWIATGVAGATSLLLIPFTKFAE